MTQFVENRRYANVITISLPLILAALLFALSACASAPLRRREINIATSPIQEDQVIGVWRASWEEQLRPKFTTEGIETYPLLFKFQMKDAKLTGAITRDYIGLRDMPGTNVKQLILTKRETRELSDLKLDGNTFSFKESFGGEDIEEHFEIGSENIAYLSSSNFRSKKFIRWATLRREKTS